MKGYSFRLGAVLRVRRVETLLAHQRVGMAARELAAAFARERDMDNNYEAAVGVLGEVAGTVFAAKREAGERLADILAMAVGDRMKRQDHLGQERLGAVRAERRVAVLDDFATVRAAAGAMGAAGVD